MSYSNNINTLDVDFSLNICNSLTKIIYKTKKTWEVKKKQILNKKMLSRIERPRERVE